MTVVQILPRVHLICRNPSMDATIKALCHGKFENRQSRTVTKDEKRIMSQVLPQQLGEEA